MIPAALIPAVPRCVQSIESLGTITEKSAKPLGRERNSDHRFVRWPLFSALASFGCREQIFGSRGRRSSVALSFPVAAAYTGSAIGARRPSFLADEQPSGLTTCLPRSEFYWFHNTPSNVYKFSDRILGQWGGKWLLRGCARRHGSMAPSPG
jgi:hypothetical protein